MLVGSQNGEMLGSMKLSRKAIGLMLPIMAVFALVLMAFLFRRSFKDEDGRFSVRSGRPIKTRKLEGNHWIVSRADKDAYLKDLAGVTKQITLEPNPGKEADSVTDLAILKLADESPMYTAGFRKDDRILKVNGTPIDSMGRAVNLIHEIKASNRLTVQIRRGDQIVNYQFDFE